MNDSGSRQNSVGYSRALKMGKLVAVMIVLIMVVSPLYTAIANAIDEQASIWTSKEEYLPGDTVLIFGEGFLPGYVTITISHPDIETVVDTCPVGWNGEFLYDKYVCEWVEDGSTPVSVLAYQDDDHQAVTMFWEPAATVLCWTMGESGDPLDHARWSKGNIKGWNEGDSVPSRVDLKLSSPITVNVTIAIDYLDDKGYYGFDYLSAWNDWDTHEVPIGPFNTYPPHDSPFFIDPIEGNITEQGYLGDFFPSAGDTILEQWWYFVVELYVDSVSVRFGSHLALSDLSASPPRLGAAYYEGSSLHVRIQDIVPDVADEGNRDVPFAINKIMTPPDMTLEKWCNKDVVVYGELINFTLHYVNWGQAAATCVVLDDNLPMIGDSMVLDFIEGSVNISTTSNPTNVTFSDPVFDPLKPYHFNWSLGVVRGRGYDNGLAPYQVWITFTCRIVTAVEGCYKNWAFLNYSDDHGGVFPTEEAWCRFCILGNPAIDIVKTGPYYTHVGDIITYKYNVSNTGYVDLVVDVVDNITGTVATDVLIPAGEYRIFYKDHLVTVSDRDHLLNKANATGTDERGRVVWDVSTWEVDILHPMIDITKEANKGCGKIGEGIKYYINVTNPSSDTTLYNVTVEDSMFGVLGSDLDLSPGETLYYVRIRNIDAEDLDPLRNRADAAGEDKIHRMVNDTAYWNVDILHPAISVTKEANLSCAAAGDTITYWINVTNPSSDTPMHAVVTDPMFGGTLFDNWIAIGVTVHLGPYYKLVQQGSADPLFNEVSVIAFDSQGHVVDAKASVSVDILHPEIAISKWSAFECAAEGDIVTYWLNVSNPTIDTDMWYEVWDEMLNDSAPMMTGMLGPGEYRNVSFEYPMTGDEEEPFTNYVYVEAWDKQEHNASARDSFTIDVYHPDIVLDKWSDLRCAADGDIITFWLKVSNPSLDTSMEYQVWDMLLNASAPMMTGVLGPGEYRNSSFTYPVTGEEQEPFINRANVSAYDPQMHEATDSDSWEVDILHPMIELDKWSDLRCAADGDIITFWLKVSNPSLDTDMEYQVWDLMLNATDPMMTGVLGPGEFRNSSFTYPVTGEEEEPFVNDANVSAYDYQGHLATDCDSWEIEILHPMIVLEKWSDLTCAADGDTITYWLNVYNPSIDTDMEYQVWDLLLNASAPMMTGVLGPGESRNSSFDYEVTGKEIEPWTNYANVSAYDYQGHLAESRDSWTVDILHPMIVLDKWSDLRCAADGDTVTFYLNVSNPSLDTSMEYQVWDPLLNASAPMMTGVLGPGEYRNSSFTYPVTGEEQEPFINDANVSAYDYQGHEATYCDSWEIDILHPEITVEKTSVYRAHVGDNITYVFTITNPSPDTDLFDVNITDDVLGTIYSGTLLADTTIIVSKWYIIPDDLPGDDQNWLNNTVDAEGRDSQRHWVYDDDNWSVRILRPEIDVEKEGPEKAAMGSTITYHVNVTNIGNCELYNVFIYDVFINPPADHKIYYGGVLGVGQTWYVMYQVVVPYGEGYLVNTVRANGTDLLLLEVNDTDTWTLYKFGEVHGLKFADLSKDGIRDAGSEPGLANWVIYLNGTLTAGGTVHYTTLTASDGTFSFLLLEPGIYTLEERMLSGWSNVTTRTISGIVIGSGTNVLGKQFGNVPNGTISGYKWLDEDMNKEWDDGEMPIPHWVIYLNGTDMLGEPVALVTETDSGGYYEFTDLLPGDYFVEEQLLHGWKNTTRSWIFISVPPEPLETFHEYADFGNVGLGRVEGYKWLDEFMNGIWGTDGFGNDEDFLADWEIHLDGMTDTGVEVHLVTYTDDDGYYSFEGLLPGEYNVSEVVKEGWVNITPYYYEFTVVPGDNITCGKFGNVPLGSIWGWKFLDYDLDGAKDGSSEPGIPGWNFTLTGYLNDPAHTPVGPITVQTDADGVWSFFDLLPGWYIVTEEDREGWYHTTRASIDVGYICGHDLEEIKFGNVPLTCIWGYKFSDLNFDGRNGSEPGVAGWTIGLNGTLSNGVLFGPITTTTDEDGMFYFCGLLPGKYRVYEVMKVGWTNTTPMEWYFTVPRSIDGPFEFRHDFGNFKLGMIIVEKFEDMDGDGVKDPEDTPIQGWDVYIERIGGGLFGHNVTNASGVAEFWGLWYGDYDVYEILSGDWVATTPDSVTVSIESDDAERVLFLNTELCKIWGYKWNDLDGDGRWDSGEPGIEGWKISMLQDYEPERSTSTNANGYYEFTGLWPNATFMVWEEQRPGWTPTTYTGYLFPLSSGGSYNATFGNFLNVPITIYKFEDMDGDGVVDPEDGPLVWEFTVTDPEGIKTSVWTNSDGYVTFMATKFGTYTVNETPRAEWCNTTDPIQTSVVSSGVACPDELWFGNFECVTVTVFKYEDVYSDGDYDVGVDIPLRGWQIIAWDMIDDDDEWDDRVNYTDENGLTTFHFCHGGVWKLYEILQDGWTQITPSGDGYYLIGVQSGAVYNLTAQEECDYYEFGNFEIVEILIFKYWDKCSNGNYDPGAGDIPFPGWWFDIFGPYAMPDGDWTNNTGELLVKVYRAGSYTVDEEERAGWSHITPLSGTWILPDVKSGDDYVLWFGNYQNVSVPIFKYEDLNSDGDWDEGEPGIPGWNFTLQGSVPEHLFTGTTDGTGHLVLIVNRSDTYLLTEENKYGWKHINPANGMMSFPITSGVTIDEKRFGNFDCVNITVFKYDDVYGDGQYDDMVDDPVQGWHFTLWLVPAVGGWIFVAENWTDAGGLANFTICKAGSYVVTEDQVPGWWWVNPSDGMVDFTICSGDRDMYIMFGNFKYGQIFGHKWEDLDGDGVWDEGEPPLANWTIWFELVDGPIDVFTGFNKTDKNGYYEFNGLIPGIYRVWELIGDDWVCTNGSVKTGIVIWGHYSVEINFLNFHKGSIYGYKYEDMDGDGVKDPEDLPIEGWDVYLWDMSGTPHIIASTTTDENGTYEFTGLGPLPAGYKVVEEDEYNWVHTTPAYEMVYLTSNESRKVHDFLNTELCKIWGYKFEDLNSNGRWDSGEPAVEGWKIYMLQDYEPERNTSTNANGYYEFTGLWPNATFMVWEEQRPGWTPTTYTGYLFPLSSGGSYNATFGNFENVRVPIFKYEDVNGNEVFDAGDKPLEGWHFATVNGTDVIDSYTDEYGWANVTITRMGMWNVSEELEPGWVAVDPPEGFILINIWSGKTQTPLFFGNRVPGVVQVFKYYDQNLNGVQDGADEIGLDGWVFYLNGTDPSRHYTQITADGGWALFIGLEPDDYTLEERQLAGWFCTTIIPDPIVRSRTDLTVEVGNAFTGNITGVKFYDKDGDGVWDDGDEPVLPGWEIHLDGITKYGKVVNMTSTTNSTGGYLFEGVEPGRYNITEVMKEEGWTTTSRLPHLVDVWDVTGPFDEAFDIGNIRYAMIWGYKWLDEYGNGPYGGPNGQFDPEETGLGNWLITLQGYTESGDRVDRWVLTDNEDLDLTDGFDEIGYYEFLNILPGSYWLNETLLSGYYATTSMYRFITVVGHPYGPFVFEENFGNVIPSPDPQVQFSLKYGWNLWSTPISVTGLTAKSLLSAIGPKGFVVATLVESTGKYVSFVAGDTEGDFAITLGDGYYIWATGDTTFSLYGWIVGGTKVQLVPGWNIVGYAGLEAITASEFMSMVEGTTPLVLSCMDPSTHRYYSYVLGDGLEFDFSITPGNAYFLWVYGSGQIVY